MITAVDTNVLVDVFIADTRHGLRSSEWLRQSLQQGSIIICNVVYAELVHGSENQESLDAVLDRLGLSVSPINNDVAYEAGRRWSRYRQAGGPRNSLLADFLIVAHALTSADSFLARDDGFYQTYFPELNRPFVA